MVAADGRTKAIHHFNFRAMGAVTAQLHGSFVARTIPEWNRLPADAVSPLNIVPLEIECTTGQLLAVWSVGHSIVFSFRFITNKIPAILGRYPLLGFFCRLKTVPLDRDNGTFNSSNTDVVEKVIFWWLLDNTGVLRWWKDTHSTWTEMALFWSLFTGGSFLVDLLENEIVGFDENLTVAL